MKNAVDEHAPLSRYTTLRIGGPARALFCAESAEDVILAARKSAGMKLDWRVIGHGSNILASDDGVSCALIVYKNNEASQNDAPRGKPRGIRCILPLEGGGYPLASFGETQLRAGGGGDHCHPLPEKGRGPIGALRPIPLPSLRQAQGTAREREWAVTPPQAAGNHLSDKDGLITISGGLSLSDLVADCASRGLAGVENLAGIPGTVGGAIAGNAGAYGACIADVLASATVLTKTGEIKTVLASDLCFSYRHSFFKETGGVLLSATLKLKPADPEELNRTIRERLADRMKKHPDYKLVPTAGSWFKNPADKNGERIAAGKLLEEVGCKSLRIGGASVWPRHANIIVTDGRATARNVKELANEMAARVRQKFGITLEWEVGYLE